MTKWYQDYLYPNDLGAKQFAERVKDHSTYKTIRNIKDWFESRYRWRSDLKRYGRDYIQAPSITLESREGDCQDASTLISSSLYNLSIPSSLILGKVKKNDRWNGHIWNEVKDIEKGGVYMLDGSYSILKKGGTEGVKYSKKRVVDAFSPWLNP